MIEIEGDFQWDAEKSRDCRERRGFSFLFAAGLWRGPVNERDDDRRDYGERRIQALGRIDGLYYLVVFTWRDGRRHIISARRANMREVMKWDRL
jgi:uncharacterized DUF497 family protein